MWHNMSDSFVSYDIVNKIGALTSFSLLYHVINILPWEDFKNPIIPLIVPAIMSGITLENLDSDTMNHFMLVPPMMKNLLY